MNDQFYPKDINLRLIYAKQENDYLDGQIKYYQRSLFLALLMIIGIPVFFGLNHFFLGTGLFFLMLATFIWALFGLVGILSLFPILYRLRTYFKMKKDHVDFLTKYNRKIS